MRNFYTTVLTRKQTIKQDFQTHPYETAWAREAMFFITLDEITSGARLQAAVQVSPDGIRWADEGTAFPAIDKPGVYFVKVREFGGWLRLNCQLEGAEPQIDTTIHLALKE